MKKYIEERVIELALYVIETGTTVRSAAKKFKISKSTVHKDLTVRLEALRPALYQNVRKVLELNKSERHIRGGLATKEKYKEQLKLTSKK